MPNPFARDAMTDGVPSQGENFILGLLAGLVAAAVGAAVWAGITVVTRLHVGYVAIGVGAIVGLAVRTAGNGTGIVYGLMGALLTLLGCLGGEIMAVVALATTPQHNFLDVLTHVQLAVLVPAIFAKTSALMYFIYAIGIYEGYRLSMRR